MELSIFKNFAILIMLLGTAIFAQQSVPDVHTVSSEFERIEVVRIRSGTDMLQALRKAVKESNIKNGVILSGIGSVTAYHYHVVSSKDLPPAEEYPKASVPMDLISTQGYILDGRVHAHITL